MEDQAWLEVLLQRKSEDNCIAKIIEMSSSLATKKGDNYMSEIKRIKMDVILKSGRKIKKSIIIKGLPASEFHQELLKDMCLFNREITMYRDVVPAMEDLMTEFNEYAESIFVKMIEYRNNDIIIFQDLAETGYLMRNRKEGLDLDHCLLVLQNLAKFHALSVVLKERGLIPMEIYCRHVFKNSEMCNKIGDFYDNGLTKLLNLMETWEPEWKPVIEKLKTKIQPNLVDNIMNVFNYDDKRFNVLNHGDFWVNNMLFKYGIDNVTPISFRFVDLQMCYFSSPAYDLQYLLCTSLTMKVRETSYERLIKVYYESLVKELKFHSYSGNIITFEELEKDLITYFVFGLMTGVTLMPFVYREDSDESFPEIEDMVKDLKDEKVNLPDCSNPMYSNVLKDILKIMTRKGII